MSKLDDAFMKAYAKVREAGPNSTASKEAMSGNAAPPETPIDAGEPELISFVRLEDGMANAAAELAQTADGRTRGTAADPGGNGVAAGRGMPMGPDTKLPESDDGGGAVLIDSGQTVGAPHFHSIAVSLDAYETVGPRESVRELEPAVAAKLGEAANVLDLAALYSQSLDTMTLPQGIVPQVTPVASAPATFAPVTEPRVEPSPEVDPRPEYGPRGPLVRPSDDGASDDDAERYESTRTRTDQRHGSVAAPMAPSRDDEAARFDRERQDLEVAERELFGAHDLEADDQGQSVASGAEAESRAEMPSVESAVDASAGPAISESSFRAAWEVDCFEFPTLVWELSTETSLLWQAAEQLQLACQEGLQVLAITSPARGHGRSTLALTLSRMLAGRGLSVVLVDADVDGPDIARHLQLELETGWYDALRSGLSVDEVAVHSLDDGFTVLPLATAVSASAPRLDELTTGGMLAKLRSAFDLVLLDTTSIGGLRGWIPGTGPNCEIDAALVVQDVREPDRLALDACLKRLQQLGIDNVGLVENFT